VRGRARGGDPGVTFAAAGRGGFFYPSLVSVFAWAGGVGAALGVSRAPPAAHGGAAGAEIPGGRHRVTQTTAALVGFCLAMPWVGYPLAAGAFVIVMLRGLGSPWLVAIATGVLSAAGSHYLFAVLLDVPLPRGPW
jgi:hypothetical protein